MVFNQRMEKETMREKREREKEEGITLAPFLLAVIEELILLLLLCCASSPTRILCILQR